MCCEVKFLFATGCRYKIKKLIVHVYNWAKNDFFSGTSLNQVSADFTYDFFSLPGQLSILWHSTVDGNRRTDWSPASYCRC